MKCYQCLARLFFAVSFVTLVSCDVVLSIGGGGSGEFLMTADAERRVPGAEPESVSQTETTQVGQKKNSHWKFKCIYKFSQKKKKKNTHIYFLLLHKTISWKIAVWAWTLVLVEPT